MSATHSPLLTLREAATYLRKSPTFIYRHADEIGCVRDGGPLRFRVARLDAWITHHETKTVGLTVVRKRGRKPVAAMLTGEINELSGLPAGSVEAVS